MTWVVGIDEVGRGSLAGPLTVAALATRPSTMRYKVYGGGLKDSKQLTPKQRLIYYNVITADPAIEWATVSVGPRTIDHIGIQGAAQRAVARVLFLFRVPSSFVLLDGSLYAPPSYRQCTVIGGDAQIPLIAAASIIAKVTRDRFMERQHSRFPGYGFAVHKGYGTRAHYAALRRHGPCAIHRKSFL